MARYSVTHADAAIRIGASVNGKTQSLRIQDIVLPAFEKLTKSVRSRARSLFSVSQRVLDRTGSEALQNMMHSFSVYLPHTCRSCASLQDDLTVYSTATLQTEASSSPINSVSIQNLQSQ